MTELKTQELIAQAVSEKEAIEMKEMKPSEANPNDAVLSHKDTIIPPQPSATPIMEDPENELKLEEKVEMPPQGALPVEVAASMDIENKQVGVAGQSMI